VTSPVLGWAAVVLLVPALVLAAGPVPKFYVVLLPLALVAMATPPGVAMLAAACCSVALGLLASQGAGPASTAADLADLQRFVGGSAVVVLLVSLLGRAMRQAVASQRETGALLSASLDATQEPFAVLRGAGQDGWTVEFLNTAAARALGRSDRDAAAGCALDDVFPGPAAGWLAPRLAEVAASGDALHLPEVETALPGEERPRIHDVFLGPSGPRRVVVSWRDVTDLHRARWDLEAAHDRARHEATHDALTGLPNRTLLLDRLEVALHRADRDGAAVAVMFCDLDRFKHVNDVHGHAAGDVLLAAVADRLARSVRSGDTVARLSGDEFVVVLAGIGGGWSPGAFYDKLRAAVEDPVDVGTALVRPRLSAGMAVSHPGCSDPGSLLRDADTAMYASKRDGGARLTLFDDGVRVRMLEDLTDEQELRDAADMGQLRLHYQPVVDLGLDRVVGHEALLRWEHPRRGLLGPQVFLPLAERSGAIDGIGEWVLRQALADLPTLEGAPYSWVAVNVSPVQLEDDTFLLRLRAALAATGADPRRLVLEITESARLDARGSVRGVLEQVRALGVGIALDDFGVGHARFSHLEHLPLTTVKLDRSLLEGERTARKLSLLTQLAAMADAVGAVCVMEGIETAEQRELCLEVGIARGQGFLLGRPEPLAAAPTHAPR
jgi:diguanylate cyclase (GGDEF)-like protein